MELAKQRAVLVADLARRGARDALIAYRSLVEDFADELSPPMLLDLLPRPAQFYLKALMETRAPTQSDNKDGPSHPLSRLPTRTVHDRARVCFHWDVSVQTVSRFFNNTTSQDFFRSLSQFAGKVDMEPALRLLQEAYDDRMRRRSHQGAKTLASSVQPWNPSDVRRAMRRSGRFGKGITRTRQNRCRRCRQDEPGAGEEDADLSTIHPVKMGGLAPNCTVSDERAALRDSNHTDVRTGTELYGGLQQYMRLDSAQHKVSWNRLRLGQELDGIIVEAVLRLLTAASPDRQICVVPPLCSETSQPLPYRSVSQLTKLVLATIRTGGSHWALAVVRVPEQSIDLFGAIGGEASDDKIVNLLSQRLASAVLPHKPVSSSRITWLSEVQAWPVRRPPNTTQHCRRAEDSGVELLVYALYTIANVSIPIHIDVELWRRIIVYLTEGPLHAIGGSGEDSNDGDETSPSHLLQPGGRLLDVPTGEHIEDLSSQLPPGISGAQPTSMGVLIEYIIMYETHQRRIAEKGAQTKKSQAACLVVDEVASVLGILAWAEPCPTDAVLSDATKEARQRFSAVRLRLMRERDMILETC
ncbi:hypothetical protein GQ53DRAFT_886559 [Thozetella sp. PMI_491]|nr:hypothetical protein GQ53DRAFT_886559 [Thozetella sp. PMI_491]